MTDEEVKAAIDKLFSEDGPLNLKTVLGDYIRNGLEHGFYVSPDYVKYGDVFVDLRRADVNDAMIGPFLVPWTGDKP